MILSKITHRKNWTWTASSHLSRGYLISVDIWSRHETSSNIPRFSNWKSQILGISSTRQFASPCMLQIFEAQEHVDLFSCYDCQDRKPWFKNCCQQHLAPQNACLRVSVCLSWPHASLWSSGDRRTLLPDCPRKNGDPAAGLHDGCRVQVISLGWMWKNMWEPFYHGTWCWYLQFQIHSYWQRIVSLVVSGCWVGLFGTFTPSSF